MYRVATLETEPYFCYTVELSLFILGGEKTEWIGVILPIIWRDLVSLPHCGVPNITAVCLVYYFCNLSGASLVHTDSQLYSLYSSHGFVCLGWTHNEFCRTAIFLRAGNLRNLPNSQKFIT